MRFLKGDVIREDDCEEQVLANEYSWELTAELIRQGWRLLHTAREEWQRKHDVCSAFAWWEGTTHVCPECGEMPTESRSEDEIAALKAGKAAAPEPAPQMTQDEWDARHKVHLAHVRCTKPVGQLRAPTMITERVGAAVDCVHCGPRPPKQPVATEWSSIIAPDGRCGCGDWACDECPVQAAGELCSAPSSAWEIRWPSGVVGEGQPEFRRVGTEPTVVEPKPSDGMAQWNKMTAAVARRWAESEERIILGVLDAPAAVVEPERVPIEKSKPHVMSRISGGCYDAGKLLAEGDGSECPRCDTPLPSQLASLIRSGAHDCPSCGWHSGRCDHCLELLVSDYRIGERDHGQVHCPRCQGVDE